MWDTLRSFAAVDTTTPSSSIVPRLTPRGQRSSPRLASTVKVSFAAAGCAAGFWMQSRAVMREAVRTTLEDPSQRQACFARLVDQPRNQVSEMHFDKFPALATFQCWDTSFKTEVCSCSAMHWIKEVEMVESVDDLKSSHSVGERPFPIF